MSCEVDVFEGGCVKDFDAKPFSEIFFAAKPFSKITICLRKGFGGKKFYTAPFKDIDFATQLFIHKL